MELLSILASIAASLVGFTGLLTAFRVRTDSLSPNDVTNIRILLIYSVSALVFAVLPIPLLAFDAHPALMKVLTGLFGTYLLFWSMQSPAWMRRRRLRPRNPALYWSIIVLQAVLGIGMVVGAALASLTMAVFTLGVLWCLLTAIIVFVVQIFVMLPIAGSKPEA